MWNEECGMPRRVILAICCLLPMSAVHAEESKEIEALVREVGIEDHAVSWKAQQRLAQIGEKAVDPILSAMEDAQVSPGRAKTLASVLEKIRSPKAAERLIRLFERAADSHVREAVLDALLGQTSQEARVFFESCIKGEDSEIRAMATKDLGECRDPADLPMFVDLLGDEDDYVREMAVIAMGKQKSIPGKHVPALMRCLAREELADNRAELVGIMFDLCPPDAVAPAMEKHLGREKDPPTRRLIEGWLQKLKTEKRSK